MVRRGTNKKNKEEEEEDSDGDEESLSNSQNVSLIKNQMVIIQRSLITGTFCINSTLHKANY